jgi:hypothetical protein
MSDLAAALMVAIRTHAAQVDKQGEPYLLHVLRVVEAVSNEAKVVAALHDVVEDGGEDADCAVLGLNLTSTEARAVRILTRIKGVPYADYIGYLAADVGPPDARRIAREVKLADLRDNLGRMPVIPKPGEGDDGSALTPRKTEWASLKRRYEKAIKTLEAR